LGGGQGESFPPPEYSVIIDYFANDENENIKNLRTSRKMNTYHSDDIFLCMKMNFSFST
jgi:hypothetical protein